LSAVTGVALRTRAPGRFTAQPERGRSDSVRRRPSTRSGCANHPWRFEPRDGCRLGSASSRRESHRARAEAAFPADSARGRRSTPVNAWVGTVEQLVCARALTLRCSRRRRALRGAAAADAGRWASDRRHYDHDRTRAVGQLRSVSSLTGRRTSPARPLRGQSRRLQSRGHGIITQTGRRRAVGVGGRRPAEHAETDRLTASGAIRCREFVPRDPCRTHQRWRCRPRGQAWEGGTTRGGGVRVRAERDVRHAEPGGAGRPPPACPHRERDRGPRDPANCSRRWAVGRTSLLRPGVSGRRPDIKGRSPSATSSSRG
jgi:hypothetical protein